MEKGLIIFYQVLMKYLIDYNKTNNIKGGGSWIERFCPLCGIALNMSSYLDEKLTIDLLKEDIEYINAKRKLSNSQKKKSINEINLKIDRVKELVKIKKDTFFNLNSEEENITVLLPEGKNYKAVFDNGDYLFDIKEIGQYNLSFYFYGNEKYHDVTDDNKDLLGLPMHTCCWNLAKKKFKHELTFEDFFNNKFEKIIPSKKKIDYFNYYLIEYLNYKPSYKYTLEKYWDYNINNEVNDFLLNKMDWYIVYLPDGNSPEAKKNSKRIERNIKKVINGIIKPKKENSSKDNITKKYTKKDRPSPSESATQFKEGTKKKGNDGNMYIIVINKNGVKRWKKV